MSTSIGGPQTKPLMAEKKAVSASMGRFLQWIIGAIGARDARSRAHLTRETERLQPLRAATGAGASCARGASSAATLSATIRAVAADSVQPRWPWPVL